MSLIQIEGVSKSFGTDVLFEPFTAQISRGDRIALVGDNAVGKSTLLSIIAGDEAPTGGEVRAIGKVRIGYLPQVARLSGEGRLKEAMERPFAGLLAMEKELRRLERKIAESSDPTALHRYDDLINRFAEEGGYTIEARVRAALAGVGLSKDDLFRDRSTGSKRGSSPSRAGSSWSRTTATSSSGSPTGRGRSRSERSPSTAPATAHRGNSAARSTAAGSSSSSSNRRRSNATRTSSAAITPVRSTGRRRTAPFRSGSAIRAENGSSPCESSPSDTIEPCLRPRRSIFIVVRRSRSSARTGAGRRR